MKIRKYVVTARAFDRETGEPAPTRITDHPDGSRDETIDVATNALFAGCETILEVKRKYESFWNDLNPNSEHVVFVSKVRIVGDGETTKDILPKPKPRVTVRFRSIVRADMVKALAVEFCKELLECLGEEKMREVVARNAAETDDNICHSHDFCDANQVMLDAMKKLGFELDDGLDDGENNHEGINLAWDLAKKNSFQRQKITD
jgi:hypothetical protein